MALVLQAAAKPIPAMFDLIFRIAATGGIIWFCWSVCVSLDAIARELRRLADARDRTTPPSPPTNG